MSRLLGGDRDRQSTTTSAWGRRETENGQPEVAVDIDLVDTGEPELKAIEAVFPEVQERHQKNLERIERMSELDLGSNKAQLKLRIDSCRNLKEGDWSDRLPDPFVVAKFIELNKPGVSSADLWKQIRPPGPADGAAKPAVRASLSLPRARAVFIFFSRAAVARSRAREHRTSRRREG